jgi:hypothetical protein
VKCFELFARRASSHLGGYRKAANLARDFMNLIRPGREVRKSMKCDRGTARSALASIDHVIRDIENNAILPLS